MTRRRQVGKRIWSRSDIIAICSALGATVAGLFTGAQWWEAHAGGEVAAGQLEAARKQARAATSESTSADKSARASAQLSNTAQKDLAIATLEAETAKNTLEVTRQEARVSNLNLQTAETQLAIYREQYYVQARPTFQFHKTRLHSDGSISALYLRSPQTQVGLIRVNAHSVLRIIKKASIVNLAAFELIRHKNQRVWSDRVAIAKCVGKKETDTSPSDNSAISTDDVSLDSLQIGPVIYSDDVSEQPDIRNASEKTSIDGPLIEEHLIWFTALAFQDPDLDFLRGKKENFTYTADATICLNYRMAGDGLWHHQLWRLSSNGASENVKGAKWVGLPIFDD